MSSMKNYLDHLKEKKVNFVFLHRDLSLLFHHSDTRFGWLPNFSLFKPSWKTSGAVCDWCPSSLRSSQGTENSLSAHGWGHTLPCLLRGPLEELLEKPHFAGAVQGMFPASSPTCFKCHPQLPFSYSLPLR